MHLFCELSFLKNKKAGFNSLFVIIMLFTLTGFSQNNEPKWGVELKTHYSFLMVHHKHMNILAEQHFPVVQLNVFKTGDHGKEWQQLYRYPHYGVSLIYTTLSSPQYLGAGYGLISYASFPQFRANRFSANFFVGGGIGYVEKIYDMRENYKNISIGTHLNAVLQGQADFRYRISSKSEISAGISILHFSNGKIKVPNLGINNVGAFVGYSHHIPYNRKIREVQPENLTAEKYWEHNVFFASALKQIYPIGSDYFLYTALSFNTKRILNRKRKVGIGVDVVYDFSDRAHFRNKGFDMPDISYAKPGIYGIHDFRLGKLSIFIHIGTYLYAFEKNQDVGLIYDRTGLQYFFNDNLSIMLALRKHYAKADCIEFGINYSFVKNNRKNR